LRDLHTNIESVKHSMYRLEFGTSIEADGHA
jgi:hypothetical protein